MIIKRIADDDTRGRNRRAGKDPAGGSGKRPYCFMLHRYSSRRSQLRDFLSIQLQGARLYDRIAGFFSTSLLEVAGEALERMTPEGGETCVRVVCNSCLNTLDIQTARAAKLGGAPRMVLFAPRRDRHTHGGQAPASPRFSRQRPSQGEGPPRRGLRPDPRQGRRDQPDGRIAGLLYHFNSAPNRHPKRSLTIESI